MAKKAKKAVDGLPDGFPEKSWNKLPEGWRDAVQSKKSEELEKEIIKSVRSMSATSFDMKNDAKLETLQEDLKALKGGYTEVISGEKAKIDYCVYLLNSRGMPITSDIKSDIKKAVEDSEDE